MGTDFELFNTIKIDEISERGKKRLKKQMEKIEDFPFFIRGEEIVHDPKYRHGTEEIHKFIYSMMKMLEKEDSVIRGVCPFMCSWGDYEAGAIYYCSCPVMVKTTVFSNFGNTKFLKKSG